MLLIHADDEHLCFPWIFHFCHPRTRVLAIDGLGQCLNVFFKLGFHFTIHYLSLRMAGGGKVEMDDSLNAEEREILEHFERGTLVSAPDAEREMDAARRAARSTFNKTRRVNLRMTELDFNLAHARAREEGIP